MQGEGKEAIPQREGFFFYNWGIKLRVFGNIITSTKDRSGGARHKRIIISYEPERTT